MPFAKGGSLLRGHWLSLTCLLSSCRMSDVLPAHQPPSSAWLSRQFFIILDLCAQTESFLWFVGMVLCAGAEWVFQLVWGGGYKGSETIHCRDRRGYNREDLCWWAEPTNQDWGNATPSLALAAGQSQLCSLLGTAATNEPGEHQPQPVWFVSGSLSVLGWGLERQEWPWGWI